MRVNVQMGENPLRRHQPTQYISSSLSYTVGEDGQIVGWVDGLPQFVIQPCISGECRGKVICSVVGVREISNGESSLKLVCMHGDGRLRIFNGDDGVCTNISGHHPFTTQIIGIAESTHTYARFILCFDKETVWIFDYWAMGVVGHIPMGTNHYCAWSKATLNEHKQLQMVDVQGKVYSRDIGKLFAEVHLDIGSLIFAPHLAQQPLQTILLELQQPMPLTPSFSKPHHSSPIPSIHLYLQQLRHKSIWHDLFTHECEDHPIVQYIKQLDQQPITSTLYFLKDKQLWYWVGCNKGTLLGIPAILTHHSTLLNLNGAGFGPVAYVQIVGDVLMVSWSNGMFHGYDIGRLPKECEAQSELVMDLEDRIYQEKLSSSIKHRLDLYHASEGEVTSRRYAFQLENNEVVIFDSTQPTCYSLRGIASDTHIYMVLEMNHHYAVAHQHAIELFDLDAFQRSIDYDSWEWSDFYSDGCDSGEKGKVERKCVSGVSMIEQSERYLTTKLDFYKVTPELYNQSAGQGGEKSLGKFLHSRQAEKTIHSVSLHNATSILSITRNKTWVLCLNLNTQLRMLHEQPSLLQSLMSEQYSMLGTFLWDYNYVPFLSILYGGVKKKFLLHRRYTQQGLGKCMVTYLSNKAKHKQSTGATENAIASTGLLCALNKRKQHSDGIGQVTEYFSNSNQHAKIDARVVCRIAASGNEHILEACLRLATCMGKQIPLYPIYEYFILNYKQMHTQQVSEVEAGWIVYLYASVLYGESVDAEQAKPITSRLLAIISQHNCNHHPHLVLVMMRILNRSMNRWRKYIDPHTTTELYPRLFRVLDACNGSDEMGDQKGRRKLRSHLMATIISLAKYFANEFYQSIRAEVGNQKLGESYPITVLQIMREYLKVKKENADSSVCVELLLQCIGLMSQSLKKHTQQKVVTIVQELSNDSVCFNGNSHKIGVRTQDSIHIYCLKAGKKVKSIPVKEQPNTVVKMSPKGNYIALLGEKVRVWKITTGFWSGMLRPASNAWVFDVSANDLRWGDSQDSLTLIHSNPSFNRYIRL